MSNIVNDFHEQRQRAIAARKAAAERRRREAEKIATSRVARAGEEEAER